MTDEAIPFVPRGKPALSQDPHKVRDISERNLEAAIGREVRAFRRQQGLNLEIGKAGQRLTPRPAIIVVLAYFQELPVAWT